MNEKECRKLAKELNEKTHYNFRIRKQEDGKIILKFSGELGVDKKMEYNSFEHVALIMEKLTR